MARPLPILSPHQRALLDRARRYGEVAALLNRRSPSPKKEISDAKVLIAKGYAVQVAEGETYLRIQITEKGIAFLDRPGAHLRNPFGSYRGFNFYYTAGVYRLTLPDGTKEVFGSKQGGVQGLRNYVDAHIEAAVPFVMAGRPLRQLRNALRLNPLVGWEDLSGMPPAKAEPPFVTLVKPGAKDRYETVYNRVDIPLAVVLRPGGWDGDRGSRNLLGKAGAPHIQRAVRQYREDEALAKKTKSVLLVVSIHGRKGWENEPRGSAGRESPYTPFVLLHRLGDFLARASEAAGYRAVRAGGSGELVKAGEHLLDIRKKKIAMHGGDEEEFEITGGDPFLLSKGVDTEAGRRGVLVDVDADLFAKWLLSGRFAYDAAYPPSESREERAYRSAVAKGLPLAFQSWHAYLRRSAPSVFYI